MEEAGSSAHLQPSAEASHSMIGSSSSSAVRTSETMDAAQSLVNGSSGMRTSEPQVMAETDGNAAKQGGATPSSANGAPAATLATQPLSAPSMKDGQALYTPSSDDGITIKRQAASPEAAGAEERELKKVRLGTDSKLVADSRLSSLRQEVDSEPQSPSVSRASSPSIHSPTTATPQDTGGYGGAKRRNLDGHQTLPRNIDRVYLGDYDIKTWYYSPYPLGDEPLAAGPSSGVQGRVGSPSARRTASGTTTAKQSRGRSSLPVAALGKQEDSSTGSGDLAPTNGTNHSSVTTGSPVVSQPNRTATSSEAVTSVAPKVPHLWICEGCFKYMRSYAGWNAHKRECPHRHPPGRKVYQRGAHIIWEVDGSQQKLYAQNLSLFGKLFIDHKTIFFDVEPFLFYVVTDASANFDYVLGYFSKERVSYDDYNLACIITFPPFQKKGFGTLMIELSYHLSAKSAVAGTPERPLSELGFKGYVSYWAAVVLRTLALAFHEDNAEAASRLLPQAATTTTPTGSTSTSPTKAAAAASATAAASRAQKRAGSRIRSILLGAATTASNASHQEAARAEGLADQLESSEDLTPEELADLRRVRRSLLGFAGEVPPALAAKLATKTPSNDSRPRKAEGSHLSEPPSEGQDTAASASASSSSQAAGGTVGTATEEPTVVGRQKLDRAARHLTPSNGVNAAVRPLSDGTSQVKAVRPDAQAIKDTLDEHGRPQALCTTLQRISSACNLRVDDCAFALSECGLLRWRLDKKPNAEDGLLLGADTISSTDATEAGTPLGTAALEPVILITREAVRSAILERDIKRPVLDTQYVFV